MKKFERIFLYSVLAILVFYVFLVDNKDESQVAIQEEIRARRIVIVNDEGREVVLLSASKDGSGKISVGNKDGNLAGIMTVSEFGGSMLLSNKDGKFVAGMIANEYGGVMNVYNKDGTHIAGMTADEDGNGIMGVGNKDGTPVVGMGVSENGNGTIKVLNKDGKMIGSLP